MEETEVIRFSHVGFTFNGKDIIKDFSESIHTGEHVCFMGESGAGKSTLLNSLAGLRYPSSGEVFVKGMAVTPHNIQKIRSSISWLPQEVQLPYNTVMQMMLAPYEFAVNKNIRFDKDLCVRYIEQVGLPSSILDKKMTLLSGGEKQRLTLVSSLVLGRKIILMDEPTSALDAGSRKKVTGLLNSLKDTTILSITHDAEFAHEMDRTITLKKL